MLPPHGKRGLGRDPRDDRGDSDAQVGTTNHWLLVVITALILTMMYFYYAHAPVLQAASGITGAVWSRSSSVPSSSSSDPAVVNPPKLRDVATYSTRRDPNIVCATIWDPVCGVDGQTYPNMCELNAHGVALAFRGECIPQPPRPDMPRR